MPKAFQALLVAAALAGSSLPACAVTGMSTATQCSVTGTEFLRADIGGAQAICAEIQQVLGTSAPAGTRVEVRIQSTSHVSARTMLANGRTLPAVSTSVSDSTLDKGSIEMLARGLAEQLAALL